MIKTRIAPTPSGFLHLGNVLSFSLTAGLAAKMNARIVLRIDDLDRERIRKPYVQDIFDTLEFLDIPWHEGPADFRDYEREYSQVHRLDLYREALQQLKGNGALFACTCSRMNVFRRNGDRTYPGTCRDRGTSFDAENVSWRLRTKPGEVVEVNTAGGARLSAPLPAHMQDFIVRRKNGIPSYQLASTVDDLYHGINLVVRGEDLWDSTLAQLVLASMLEPGTPGKNPAFFPAAPVTSEKTNATFETRPGLRQAVFLHHKLLKSTGGWKMSKSAGAVSIQYLRKRGKRPAEIYSLISSLLQLDEPARNWRSLANAVMERQLVEHSSS